MQGGERRKRDCRSFLVGKIVGHFGNGIAANSHIFSKGSDVTKGQAAIHSLAHRESADFTSHLLYGSTELIAHYERHRVGNDEFHFATNNHVVERVNTSSVHLDKYFICFNLWHGDFCNSQVTSMLVILI